MALLHVSFFSKTLMRTVPLSVFLPCDSIGFDNQYLSNGPYKAVVLLHGVMGSEQDWINQTRVLRYAKEKNVVLIMPSGENHFYVDQPWNYTHYGEFIGKELPEIGRRMFPISSSREDLAIAGLSMGGYGALRNGIKYNETFGVIGSFSGVISENPFQDRGDKEKLFFQQPQFLRAMFKDESYYKQNGNQLYIATETVSATSSLCLFLTCGTDDWLLRDNRNYSEFLRRHAIPFTYKENSGGHDWDFWDWSVKEFLDWWIPDKNIKSISSGNVR